MLKKTLFISSIFFISIALFCSGCSKLPQSSTAADEDQGITLSTSANLTTKAIDIADGEYFSMILDQNGRVWAKGINTSGQLGTNSTINYLEWISVLDGVSQIACGNDCGLALKTNGDLYVTGYNENGQLGLGNTLNHKKWIKAQSNIKKIYPNIIAIDNNDNLLSPIYDMDRKNENPTWKTLLTNVEKAVYQNGVLLAIKTDHTLWSLNTLHALSNEWTLVTTNIIDVAECSRLGLYKTVFIKDDNSLWQAEATTDYKEKYVTYTLFTKIGDGYKKIYSIITAENFLNGGPSMFALTINGDLWTQNTISFGLQNTPSDYLGPKWDKFLTNVQKISVSIDHITTLKTDNTVWLTGNTYYFDNNKSVYNGFEKIAPLE